MKPIDKQTILITGSTDGIGKASAEILARRGARVLIHGRNASKVELVLRDLKEKTENEKLEGFTDDLSSAAGVRTLAEEVRGNHSELDVLINNAGSGFADSRYSPEGVELRLMVNYLAPYLLTKLLLPLIRNAAPSRIVNVASAGQYKIDFSDIMMEKKFDPVKAYSRSKLALIMHSMNLAEELTGNGVTVNSLHPGTYLDTNMVRNAGIKPWGNAQTGADAVVFLAVDPSLEHVTGKYFNIKTPAKPDPQAYDLQARRQLKEFTANFFGLK